MLLRRERVFQRIQVIAAARERSTLSISQEIGFIQNDLFAAEALKDKKNIDDFKYKTINLMTVNYNFKYFHVKRQEILIFINRKLSILLSMTEKTKINFKKKLN